MYMFMYKEGAALMRKQGTNGDEGLVLAKSQQLLG